VVLINLEGEYYALCDVCTHEEASLADGTIVGDELECPLHGGAFEIRSGKPAAMPVVTAAETFRVRVVGDVIEVARNA
ncbi:MAG: Rieske 2Fe-2S domain-containing protein, partial [Thermomicrobiales bacterium]|nr:Rieske 2Fe-2S domain-containing protein [Thermomicrobiales bacterium]